MVCNMHAVHIIMLPLCVQLMSSNDSWEALDRLLDELLLVCDVSKVIPLSRMSVFMTLA